MGCGIGLFIFAYLFIKPLRQGLFLLGSGIVLVILGIFNMKGNIATIHWYNRRKVTKENQKPYCFIMGLGTLVIGVCLIGAGIVRSFVDVEASAYLILGGVIISFVLMLYAQIKYNKGIF